MAEFASKGVAGTALGLGAGALGVQLLNGNMNGLLGNLFGNNHNNGVETLAAAAMLAAANGRTGGCDEHAYDRYDARKDARIAELETEVKLRDANTYTDQKLLEVYRHIDGKLEHVDRKLCEQAVWNTAQTGTISCMAQQIAALQGLTKLVIPGSSICPEMMPRYNSWTAPTATDGTTTG